MESDGHEGGFEEGGGVLGGIDVGVIGEDSSDITNVECGYQNNVVMELGDVLWEVGKAQPEELSLEETTRDEQGVHCHAGFGGVTLDEYPLDAHEVSGGRAGLNIGEEPGEDFQMKVIVGRDGRISEHENTDMSGPLMLFEGVSSDAENDRLEKKTFFMKSPGFW